MSSGRSTSVQSVMLRFMDQPLTVKEQEAFHQALLKLCISSALTFSAVESKEFRRSAVRVLPSRRQLSNTLLQKEVSVSRLENLAAIRKLLIEGSALLCLVMDG